MPGYPENPIEHLLQIIKQPFAYGVNDCCIAVADVLEPRFGLDLIGRFRGRYNTETGFMRILKREGCGNVGEAMAMLALENDLIEVNDPKDLDLGLITYRMNDKVFQAPAFYHSNLWHARSHQGVLALIESEKIWRLP